ncbi:DUF1501 domain-containing protein [Verrucomicrobium spinosum]|uniref:DUF1501 domain-containing protein n=1 Tax=Verrucomicrobium spinosum TaxID=2736 RepID=UPI00017453D7|nr:DUF1501 domain-containing protein [Verrucomicrobium spinosum]
MISPSLSYVDALNRRTFLGGSARTLGFAALGSLITPDAFAAGGTATGLSGWPHLPVKARRVIYLFQSGAPSQMDLFDHKPSMAAYFGKDLPDSVRKGQRLTGMTSGQKSLPVAPSVFKFAEHGESRATISELMPHVSQIADDLCFIKSMHTEAINHDPAITFFQTGRQIAGYPSMGSWLSYGLGSENKDLPAFVVLTSFGSGRKDCQPLASRLWGSGFLPSEHQGVRFRNSGDPVLYLSNPGGMSPSMRRRSLDVLNALNEDRLRLVGDPEIQTRIAQYEMAFRMQTSVPDLTDMKDEPQHILDMYGPDVKRPGSYAANCLLARRLAERDVRFVQLFHMGWDQHFNLPKAIQGQCHDTDQPTAALIKDLKQRGLLEDTLIVWGGEFGRTIYSQGTLTESNYGRDHHPRCFTVFLAGGGIKPGMTMGETDEFCYNITKDPVSIYDLHATMLDRLGIDHNRLSHKFQGLDARLTGVEGAKVVKPILA